MPLEITALLEPIAGENPGGVSLRYDPLYDQIRVARIEEEDLPSGGWERERKTADYALVVRLATDALSKRSKDLQIAAWLVEALLKRENFGGLATGLRVLHSLVQDFWDHLHPQMEEEDDLEFRAAPLEWVGQYLDRAVRMIPIDAAGHTIAQMKEAQTVGRESDATTYEARDARKAAIAAGRITGEEFDAGFGSTTKAWYKQLVADIDASLEALDALDLVCQDRFGYSAPRLSPLRGAIAEVRQEVMPLLAKKLEAEPDPVEEVAPPPPEAAAEEPAGDVVASSAGPLGTPGAAATPVSTAPVPKTRADAEGRLAVVARYVRTEAPTNPASYLMLRGFRWGELRSGDGRIDPKALVAPAGDVRTRLKTLLLDGQWRELLDAAEEAMATPCGRGWLDLQRYAVTACEALGGEYGRVAGAIRGELRLLLKDVPALASMAMTDDAPAANPETLAWLRAQGLFADGGDTPVVAQQTFRRDPVEAAEELVRAKQPQKAVELLMREAQQERSARSRFLRRSQAAAIMVESGLEPVALPVLQQLSELIQKHALEEWEDGETIARALGLLYRCLVKLGANSSMTQELYLRICRLDPVQGMQLPSSQ